MLMKQSAGFNIFARPDAHAWPDLRFFSHNRHRTDDRTFQYMSAPVYAAAAANHAGPKVSVFADNCSVPDDGTFEVGIGPDCHVISENRTGIDFNSGSNPTIVADHGRYFDDRAIVNKSILTYPKSRSNLVVVAQIQFDLSPQRVVLSFPVNIKLADIAPVTLGDVTVHRLVFFQQQGKQVFREVALFMCRQVVQYGRF